MKEDRGSPTKISVFGTPRCNRFTASTVTSTKTRSNWCDSDFLPSWMHRGQKQSGGGRRHALQAGGDQIVVAVER